MAIEIGAGGGPKPNPINFDSVKKAIEEYNTKLREINNTPGYHDSDDFANPFTEVEQPEAEEEQVAEPVAQPTVTPTESVTETPNPLAETETKEEEKVTATPTPEIVSQDASQSTKDYQSTIGAGQANTEDESTATDWAKGDKDSTWDKTYSNVTGKPVANNTTATTQPASGLLAGGNNFGTSYAAGLNTNIELPEGYDPDAGKQALGDTIKSTVIAIGKGIYNPIADNSATFGVPVVGQDYRMGVDSNGTIARIIHDDKSMSNVPFIWSDTDGKWVQAEYNERTKTYVPLAMSTAGGLAGQYQNDAWQDAYENASMRGNPTGATTGAATGRITTYTPKTNDTSSGTAGNPINTATPTQINREDVTVTTNGEAATTVDNYSNIRDVSISDTAIHYEDPDGTIHSVPLATEKGQEILDSYFDINPNDVNVSDTTVSYFDENGDYHVIPLASEKGQEIQKYVDSMGGMYGKSEADYAKAIEMIGEYNTNNNYPTVGTNGNPINEADLVTIVTEMRLNPNYSNMTDEQIYAEAIRYLQAQSDAANGKPFRWSEDLPLSERVPYYNATTGTGNAAFNSIMNDGRTVSGFESAEDITYQDGVLHMFDNPEYSNSGSLPTENGAGFSGVMFPESSLAIAATSKFGAADTRNGEYMETVSMSDEQYTQAVVDFVEANPQIAKMLEAGKVTLDGIIAHFFKANVTDKGGGGYRGYGSGYYRGGGGGGYRGGGGGSYSTSNNAGSTTQNQQRVYNIMKNWSF